MCSILILSLLSISYEKLFVSFVCHVKISPNHHTPHYVFDIVKGGLVMFRPMLRGYMVCMVKPLCHVEISPNHHAPHYVFDIVKGDFLMFRPMLRGYMVCMVKQGVWVVT
jgi:hypothetical protein